MKLWLLDADVIIDLFALGKFALLASQHQISVALSVMDEVLYFVDEDGNKHDIHFQENYVDKGIVSTLEGTAEDVKAIYTMLPQLLAQSIHDGEVESLAILVKNEDLTFCTCDGAAIKTLPYLDCSHRGISVERLLRTSGITLKHLQDRHTEQYFQEKLSAGKTSKIYGI